MTAQPDIFRALKRRLRGLALRRSNVGRLRRFIWEGCGETQIPLLIILTPDLVHMAPLAVALKSPAFWPVFILNGVSKPDRSWLDSLVGDVKMFELKASLTGNSKSLIEHGTVIEYFFEASRHSFCIQDADCFVTDERFFADLKLNESEQFATGPFTKDLPQIKVPDTFFLYLNAPLFRRLRSHYGLIARTSRNVPKKFEEIAAKAGFPAGVYPEQKKGAFDTLQLFWILAGQLGARFKQVPGEGERVFHIGGTSYLSRETSDLAHWDFWPMNVHYFNLRLLSLPKCARFRERFASLTRLHGDCDSLLANSPEYRRGWRHAQVEHILERLNADRIYA